MERLLLAMALMLSTAAFPKGVEVRFPGPGIELVGRLYVPHGEGRHPAVVMLHGCSGLWGPDGEPTKSYDAWAEHLRARGFVALLVDSFGPRGERGICTQKDRRISPAKDRPRDAFAALGWLATRAGVDPGSIHLLGWSNGGITVFNALRADAPGRPAAGAQFRSAVAFYPGCSTLALEAHR